MRHARTICLILSIVISRSAAFGDELVIKRQQKTVQVSIMGGPSTPLQIFTHELDWAEASDPATVQKQTFRVYTKEEVDVKLAASDRTIAALTDRVEVLGKNVTDLAAINDALVRRLDEMEKRLAKE